MTTLHRVRVTSVGGPYLTCHVHHVYAWHWRWSLVSSRTLALHFLWETMDERVRSIRSPSSNWGKPTKREKQLLARDVPLWKELGERDSTDEAWNRANVGRFVSCVGMVDHQHCDEMWADSSHERWDDRTLFETKERPSATCIIAVTDPQWLVHVGPNMEWNSTAYDHDAEVKFDPAWRTSDVRALARGISADLAFDRMPILADALQDAGCDATELLDHLRDTSATHVRGCWALDLVLGKV